MKRIAVLGANGRLGKEIVKAFAGDGWMVTALTRKGDYPKSKTISSRAVDAMDAEAVKAALTGQDVVFNGLNPIYTKWQKFALPMAENVIDAVEKTRALHLYPGNIYNYGSSLPGLIDEETPALADTRKGKIRASIETMFRQSAHEQKSRTILIRAGDFFGGSVTGSWFDQALTSKLNKGVITYPGPIDLEHAWAYLPDLAQAFLAIANRNDDKKGFQLFHFEGHTVTGAALKAAIELATGRSLKSSSIPWPMVRAIGVVYPMFRELVEMSYLWQKPHRLDGRKLAKAFPELKHTPLDRAVTHALIDLGQLDVSQDGVSDLRPKLVG